MPARRRRIEHCQNPGVAIISAHFKIKRQADLRTVRGFAAP